MKFMTFSGRVRDGRHSACPAAGRGPAAVSGRQSQDLTTTHVVVHGEKSGRRGFRTDSEFLRLTGDLRAVHTAPGHVLAERKVSLRNGSEVSAERLATAL